MHAFDRIREFAERHGVKITVLQCDDRLPSDLADFLAPFSDFLATDWVNKIVWISNHMTEDNLTLCGLVHELGHLLAMREKLNVQDELQFFGWEYLTAKNIAGITRKNWNKWTNNYMIVNRNDEEFEFGTLNPSERYRILKKAIEDGEIYGNISDSREPLAVR